MHPSSEYTPGPDTPLVRKLKEKIPELAPFIKTGREVVIFNEDPNIIGRTTTVNLAKGSFERKGQSSHCDKEGEDERMATSHVDTGLCFPLSNFTIDGKTLDELKKRQSVTPAPQAKVSSNNSQHIGPSAGNKVYYSTYGSNMSQNQMTNPTATANASVAPARPPAVAAKPAAKPPQPQQINNNAPQQTPTATISPYQAATTLNYSKAYNLFRQAANALGLNGINKESNTRFEGMKVTMSEDNKRILYTNIQINGDTYCVLWNSNDNRIQKKLANDSWKFITNQNEVTQLEQDLLKVLATPNKTTLTVPANNKLQKNHVIIQPSKPAWKDFLSEVSKAEIATSTTELDIPQLTACLDVATAVITNVHIHPPRKFSEVKKLQRRTGIEIIPILNSRMVKVPTPNSSEFRWEERADHWVMLVADHDKKPKHLLCVDPKGNFFDTLGLTKGNTKEFKEKFIPDLDAEVTYEIIDVYLGNSQAPQKDSVPDPQTNTIVDSTNCGIYCVKFAEEYCESGNINQARKYLIDHNNPADWRKEYRDKIVKATTSATVTIASSSSTTLTSASVIPTITPVIAPKPAYVTPTPHPVTRPQQTIALAAPTPTPTPTTTVLPVQQETKRPITVTPPAPVLTEKDRIIKKIEDMMLMCKGSPVLAEFYNQGVFENLYKITEADAAKKIFSDLKEQIKGACSYIESSIRFTEADIKYLNEERRVGGIVVNRKLEYWTVVQKTAWNANEDTEFRKKSAINQHNIDGPPTHRHPSSNARGR